MESIIPNSKTRRRKKGTAVRFAGAIELINEGGYVPLQAYDISADGGMLDYVGENITPMVCILGDFIINGVNQSVNLKLPFRRNADDGESGRMYNMVLNVTESELYIILQDDGGNDIFTYNYGAYSGTEFEGDFLYWIEIMPSVCPTYENTFGWLGEDVEFNNTRYLNLFGPGGVLADIIDPQHLINGSNEIVGIRIFGTVNVGGQSISFDISKADIMGSGVMTEFGANIALTLQDDGVIYLDVYNPEDEAFQFEFGTIDCRSLSWQGIISVEFGGSYQIRIAYSF